jgi:short-subunit dehydrogenase
MTTQNGNRQVAVVTGASGGIGREIARAFAGRGVDVVLAARGFGRLEDVASEISGGGSECVPVGCDVRRWNEVARLVATTVARFGRLDILVNAAGYGLLRHAAGTSVEEYEDLIQTNLLGTIYCAKAALAPMVAQRAGTIVNIGSLASVFPIPRFTAYAASKGGVAGFTESLRYDVRPYGIHVALVSPAAVRTRFFQHASFRGAPRLMRLGMTEPRDVAAAVLRAIDRRRAVVTLPAVFGLAGVARALFPGVLRWLVQTLLGPDPASPPAIRTHASRREPFRRDEASIV